MAQSSSTSRAILLGFYNVGLLRRGCPLKDALFDGYHGIQDENLENSTKNLCITRLLGLMEDQTVSLMQSRYLPQVQSNCINRFYSNISMIFLQISTSNLHNLCRSRSSQGSLCPHILSRQPTQMPLASKLFGICSEPLPLEHHLLIYSAHLPQPASVTRRATLCCPLHASDSWRQGSELFPERCTN